MVCVVEPTDDLTSFEESWAEPGPAGPVIPQPRGHLVHDDLDRVVRSAADGDPAATEQLLAFLRPLVVRHCRAKLGRQQRAVNSPDDVAQEVLLAVFRALPKYQNLGRPFLSFVYGIAAHKVTDVHRAAARDRSMPSASTPDVLTLEDSPEQITLRRELVERTGVLLRILTPRQREIVIMRVVQGMSAQETADVLDTTADAIRVAQHRALNRLRRTVHRSPRKVS